MTSSAESSASAKTGRPAASNAGAIRVEVNGDAREMPASSTIVDLLETLELGGQRVAVAINRDVVIRSRHAETRLTDGDRIEILEAVGGG